MAANQNLEQRDEVNLGDQLLARGQGGETHQVADGDDRS